MDLGNPSFGDVVLRYVIMDWAVNGWVLPRGKTTIYCNGIKPQYIVMEIYKSPFAS